MYRLFLQCRLFTLDIAIADTLISDNLTDDNSELILLPSSKVNG